MNLRMKLSLCTEDGRRFFGKGVYQLLLGVEVTGSLRSAAQDMEMSYSKAFRIVKDAEEQLGFPLTVRKIGGSGGGGSALTPQAQALMERYQALTEECQLLSEQLYQKYFSSLEAM